VSTLDFIISLLSYFIVSYNSPFSLMLNNAYRSYFIIELLLVHEKFKWKQSHPCLIPQHLQFLMWAAILNRQLILTYLPLRARQTWWMRQTILLSSVFVVILGKILYKCKKKYYYYCKTDIFHFSCPFCNLLLNLELTDPTLLQ